MNCQRCRELASEALDEALSAQLLTGFRAHLDSCPSCRLFYAELRESLTLLAELPSVDLSDSFDEAVWAKIRRAEAAPAPWWRSSSARLASAGSGISFPSAWRWVPVAAAATLLLVFAISSDTFESGLVAISDPASARDQTSPSPADEPTGLSESGDDGLELASGEDPAEIPEPIEAFLERSGRDLRLNMGERFRRSDYSYPLRRVEDSGIIRVGAGNVSGGQPLVRPVSSSGPSVIAF